jgi:hypothetical protein
LFPCPQNNGIETREGASMFSINVLIGDQDQPATRKYGRKITQTPIGEKKRALLTDLKSMRTSHVVELTVQNTFLSIDALHVNGLQVSSDELSTESDLFSTGAGILHDLLPTASLKYSNVIFLFIPADLFGNLHTSSEQLQHFNIELIDLLA